MPWPDPLARRGAAHELGQGCGHVRLEHGFEAALARVNGAVHEDDGADVAGTEVGAEGEVGRHCRASALERVAILK